MERNKQINLNKLDTVLLVAKFKSETTNRKAEDNMVKYLYGKGIALYNYFKAGFNKENIEAIRIKIKKDGFDGAFNRRLIDTEKEQV